MAWQDYLDTVQKLYVAYYQRPADPQGLRYWAQVIEDYGIDSAVKGFVNSPEAQSLYQGDIEAVIKAVYNSAFGRDPEPEGLNYWKGVYEKGWADTGTIVWAIVNGAKGVDAIVLENKLESANNFTKAIDPDLDGIGPFNATYSGDADAAAAREFLKDVNATTVKTESQAESFIKEKIADEGDPIAKKPVVTGKTFTLTNGPDIVTGTSGDDVIDGTFDANGNVTFHSFDRIDGRDGNDYLIAQGIGNLTTTTDTIKNIETVEVVEALWGTTLDLTNTQGIKTLISNASIGPWTALNLNSGIETIKVINPGGTQTFQFDTSVVSGTDNSITLEVSTVGSPTVTRTINLNPRSGTDGFETINIVTTGGDSNINLNDGTSTSLKTVNVSGSADLTLNLTPTTVTTFDASQATGNITVTFTGSDVTATGGSGDDTFLFGATFTKDDSVDGGDGNNTLGANGANLAAITTDLSNIKNIQTILVQNNTAAGTIDISHFGASNIMFADRSTPITIDNLKNGGSVIFLADGSAAITINVENAATSASDSVTIALSGQAFDPSNVNNLNIDNVETINVSTAGAGAAARLKLASADGLETLNVSGKFGLTLTVTSTSVSKVDASALEQVITVDLSNSTHGATIIATAYNDTITGSAGNDKLTGGGGNDKFVFNNFGAADKITDFSRTADDIYLDLAVGAFNANTNPNGAGNATVGGSPVILAVNAAGAGTLKTWVNTTINNAAAITARELFTAANLSALKAAVSTKMVSVDGGSYLALGKVGDKLYGLWIKDTNAGAGATSMKITATRTIATVGATFTHADIYIF